MAALNRALPLTEVDGVPVGVGKDLDLDVARVSDQSLQENPGVAKEALGQDAAGLERRPQLLLVVDLLHADPASSRNGLDQDRQPHLPDRRLRLVEVGDRLGPRKDRTPPLHALAGPHLVTMAGSLAGAR